MAYPPHGPAQVMATVTNVFVVLIFFFHFTGSLKCTVADFKVCTIMYVRSSSMPVAMVILHNSVQERLTKEIAEAILEAIRPTGVGVIIEAT